MSTSAPPPNPYAAVGLDPNLVDAESALQYESEILICKRAFSTAQYFLGLFTEVDSRYDEVSLMWHGSSVDPNEGSFAVVQSGSRLEELVGEIVRVAVGKRQVLAYVVGSSTAISAELSLARRPFLALASLAQAPGGIVATRVEVVV